MGADISLVAAEVLTLFCMMLVGVAARLFQVFTKDSTKLLSSLLVNVTQPLLILTSLQITYTEERLRTGLHIALVSAVFHVALSLLARLVYGRVKNARVLEFGTVFANCAYLGYPVLVVVFGEEGLFYGAFFTLFYNIYIRIYGIHLLTRGGKSSLFKAFVNPGTVASVVGILLFVFSIRLPAPLYNAFSAMGDVTFPLSMLVVGNLVWQSVDCGDAARAVVRVFGRQAAGHPAADARPLPAAAAGPDDRLHLRDDGRDARGREYGDVRRAVHVRRFPRRLGHQHFDAAVGRDDSSDALGDRPGAPSGGLIAGEVEFQQKNNGAKL